MSIILPALAVATLALLWLVVADLRAGDLRSHEEQS